MGRSNEGQLTHREAKELAELGAYAEKLSVENARILADAAAVAKKRLPPATPATRKTRKNVPV